MQAKLMAKMDTCEAIPKQLVYPGDRRDPKNLTPNPLNVLVRVGISKNP